MGLNTIVECDLCGTEMHPDDYPPEPVPVEVELKTLLHNIDPVVWGEIFEAGGCKSPLMNAGKVNFHACFDCIKEVLDFELIKEKFEDE